MGRRVVVADSTPTLAKPVTRIFFDGDNPALTGQAWWQSAAIDDQPTVFHGLVTESFLYDGVDHPIYSATNLLGIGCSQAGHSQSLEYFYHADERGSVKAVTFGSSGLYCEAASYAYQGYGAGSTPTDGRPGFAGAPGDASGVVFMRNRAYDPNTGTFTQPDPIGLAGGINLYGYAGNDPITFTDPFGLCPRSMRSDIAQCQRWNDQQVDKALTRIKGHYIPGRGPVIVPPPSVTTKGVNDSDIRNACHQKSDVGCTVGDTIYVNADRTVGNIGAIIEHEAQHAWALGDISLLGPKALFGEQCAVRREVLTGTVLGASPDQYQRPTTFNPATSCGGPW